jgi:glycerophosphoryl diester phosphodiesterase
MKLLTDPGHPPFTSAHRGFSTAAPENTMSALHAAWKTGATVAEIDVRLSHDGELVLMHDRDLRRTTDGRGFLADKSWAELRRLDAGRWFDESFAGERIPSLEEVLLWAKGKIGILVELKNFPDRDPRFVDRLLALFHRLDAAEGAILASFDHPTLADIHRREPEWPIQMIYHARLTDPVGAARACGAGFVSLEPEFCLAEDVAALHEAGIAALTTVYSLEDARVFHAMGVDFIEANDAGMLAMAVEEIAKHPAVAV